ncbi:hypothetical protein [Pseudoxanthomonas mexicana]|uniref:hypothetical protein n=1 Tax=Pseudoxanthomonas mexicana TaxID=128785 RepID=UPI000B0D0708|nr:hypothetical protein [Pseudoxanthomonas mexicana]
MIHAPPSSSRYERAPSQRARLAWRFLARWALAMFALAMVTTLATAFRREISEQQGATAFAESAFVQHESGEEDPPQKPKHQESPAKKPRVKALLVHTTPAADPKQPLAFYRCSDDVAPTPHLLPLRADAEPRSRRKDPVLRLHPGQAPPRLVA